MSSAVAAQRTKLFIAASACIAIFLASNKAIEWLFSGTIRKRRLNRAAEFGEALLQMEAEEQARKTKSLDTTMNQT